MSASINKVFLLLQGPPSSFSKLLGQELKKRGAKCYRINLCLGDWFYWNGKDTTNYMGSLADWPSFLNQFIKQHQVTDILYYADRFPYHREAIKVAGDNNINAITYENGYLRPHWITLEHNGMSRLSHFPSDPEYILSEGKKYPMPVAEKNLGHPFWKEAFHEVFFNLTNFFDLLFFRKYQSDKVYNPLFEYLHYIPRLFRESKNNLIAEQITEQLYKENSGFFIFPLQMQNDYQLRENSPFDHQSEAIAMAIKAFSISAPTGHKLLFKIHPLDNGIEEWSKIISTLAQQSGIEDKVLFIDGGNLNKIIKRCNGIITINSTVGVHGVLKEIPVINLGYAMYDIPGLTSQQNLNDFFINPEKPDPELIDSFVRLAAVSIQVQGSFYSKRGRTLAIKLICDKLINSQVNQPNAFVTTPPRMEHK
ncbi:capsule biosynthesis protein [Amphritea balenae]|uniref:Capsular biosynthesis protein n=1 Tax=Amphritea balenae TaxID=452629 RepID=A0A3P1SW24_9GAMM|nr:capsular biosynthesis protein [Amphritea balenae]RRD01310.1 capsular biosynthesis protein [Amphritea balenae]GGK58283.1 capsular polysaccharide biosynthesis protein [Amphritea balenae]